MIITEDTNPRDTIRLTQTMSLEELRDNERYLHRRRDEIIESIGGGTRAIGKTVLPPQIRQIDYSLTRIRIVIAHREQDFELRLGPSAVISKIEFGKPAK